MKKYAHIGVYLALILVGFYFGMYYQQAQFNKNIESITKILSKDRYREVENLCDKMATEKGFTEPAKTAAIKFCIDEYFSSIR